MGLSQFGQTGHSSDAPSQGVPANFESVIPPSPSAVSGTHAVRLKGNSCGGICPPCVFALAAGGGIEKTWVTVVSTTYSTVTSDCGDDASAGLSFSSVISLSLEA